jgi:hypothetical protein
LVFIPPGAEHELGFPFWLVKVWNIARNTGARMIFYLSESTQVYILDILKNHPIRLEFRAFPDWGELGNLNIILKPDDNLIMVLSRKGEGSYHPKMEAIPELISNFLKNHSFILIYPNQPNSSGLDSLEMIHGSLLGPIERLDFISKIISSLFRKK